MMVSMKNKIIAVILIMAMLMPTVVYAKPTESYNTPNTTAEDTDKTSPCEVTADVHYAYYVSLPAALMLEPADSVRDAKKYAELFSTTVGVSDEYIYECWYQVKAKMKDGGLGGKYIKVAPRENKESYTAFYLQEGKSQEEIDAKIENGDLDCYYEADFDNYEMLFCLQNEDTGEWNRPSICQKRIYFGDTASEKVVKVGSEKWSSIDGLVGVRLPYQGRYKGNFDFVYGLVDSID